MANILFITATFMWIGLAVGSVELEECLSGRAACAGSNNMVTVNATTVCCADPNKGPDTQQSAEGVSGCTCIHREPGKSLDDLIQAWAKESDSQGRMCQYGEHDCRGSTSNSTVNGQFKFCCRKPPSIEYITVYSATSIEYIGCRCANDTVPTSSDPSAYVVPQTGLFTSTGEDCGYNDACNDHPRLICESPQASFCCYGSRGMKLITNGDVTSCTCTHEFHGKECVSDVKPIPGSVKPCVTQCDLKRGPEKCEAGSREARCCPDHMTVNATLHGGNFTACTCSADLQSQRCQIVNTSAAPGNDVRAFVGLVSGAAWMAIFSP